MGGTASRTRRKWRSVGVLSPPLGQNVPQGQRYKLVLDERVCLHTAGDPPYSVCLSRVTGHGNE